MTSIQSQRFISLPYPLHSLLSRTILLACLSSKPLFFSQSFTVSVYFFLFLRDYLHTPLHRPSYQSCHSPFSSQDRTIGEHLPQSFRPPLSSLRITSLIRAFATLSILLIPNKPLRLSICTDLVLDLSFSFHIIVSLSYIRTGMIKVSCKTIS